MARTLSNREQIAQINLDRMGFRSYVPKIRRTIRHARKQTNVLSPMFPNYIFVILNLSHDRWRSVNGTIGVSSLIMGAELPRAVPHGVVESLAQTCDQRTIALDYAFKVGDRVRILSGPFADVVGQLDSLDERGRVRVLLEIMGGHVAAYGHRSTLTPTA